MWNCKVHGDRGGRGGEWEWIEERFVVVSSSGLYKVSSVDFFALVAFQRPWDIFIPLKCTKEMSIFLLIKTFNFWTLIIYMYIYFTICCFYVKYIQTKIGIKNEILNVWIAHIVYFWFIYVYVYACYQTIKNVWTSSNVETHIQLMTTANLQQYRGTWQEWYN